MDRRSTRRQRGCDEGTDRNQPRIEQNQSNIGDTVRPPEDQTWVWNVNEQGPRLTLKMSGEEGKGEDGDETADGETRR